MAKLMNQGFWNLELRIESLFVICLLFFGICKNQFYNLLQKVVISRRVTTKPACRQSGDLIIYQKPLFPEKHCLSRTFSPGNF